MWELINSGFVARLLSAADDAAQRNIRVQVASRADTNDVFVLPQFIGKIGPLVLPAGRALAESADVAAGRDLRWDLDGYIRPAALERLRGSGYLSDVGGQPNVRLRVVDGDVLWSETRANRLVVAWLDLADQGDRAADMTLSALQDEVRRSGVHRFPIGNDVVSRVSLSVLAALDDELSR